MSIEVPEEFTIYLKKDFPSDEAGWRTLDVIKFDKVKGGIVK